MGFIIGLLTFVLVLTCIALILLVLMQLPKKDAGAGLAFGGGATDALFGAGSGNVLTKATKYAATLFFILALMIGYLQVRYTHRSVTELEKAVASQPATLPGVLPTPETVTPTANPSVTPAGTNFQLESALPLQSTPPASTNVPTAE